MWVSVGTNNMVALREIYIFMVLAIRSGVNYLEGIGDSMLAIKWVERSYMAKI